MEVNGPQRGSRRVARELESERQCSCRQHWRQQGQLVEGEAERRVGVREDDGGIDRIRYAKTRAQLHLRKPRWRR